MRGQHGLGRGRVTQERTRFTTTQVAEALGIGYDAVWSIIRRGTPEARKIDSRLNMAIPEAVDRYHMQFLG